jgi:TRAP transporter TAXI family solute receptor
MKIKTIAALAASVAMACGQAMAQDTPKVLNMGTHGIGSLINAMGIGIGKVLTDNLGVQVKVQPGAGPTEWLPQTASGEVQLGILNNYDAQHGRAATGGYERALQNKGAPILLLTSGTRNWLGPVVSGDSNIKSCADFKGKRAVVRYTGSAGVTAQGEAVMANCGLSARDFRSVPVAGGPDKGIQAILDGTADISGSGAVGMGIIAELDARKGARFVSLDPSPQAWARFTRHFPATPRKVEPGPGRVGIKEPVFLAEYPFYLVAAQTLSEQAAYGIVRVLWEKNADLFALHARLKAWVKEGYVDESATIPYHPGAIKFYREVGAWSPQMDAAQAKLLKR